MSRGLGDVYKRQFLDGPKLKLSALKGFWRGTPPYMSSRTRMFLKSSVMIMVFGKWDYLILSNYVPELLDPDGGYLIVRLVMVGSPYMTRDRNTPQERKLQDYLERG